MEMMGMIEIIALTSQKVQMMSIAEDHSKMLTAVLTLELCLPEFGNKLLGFLPLLHE
jgi:hypothetical protein